MFNILFIAWFVKRQHSLNPVRLCRVGLVVTVSASHKVGRGFASQPGDTKNHHKSGTNSLPALHTWVIG